MGRQRGLRPRIGVASRASRERPNSACTASCTLAALTFLACGRSDETSLDAPVARAEQPLLYVNAVWTDPHISVCWERFSDSQPEHRNWVRYAVESTFEGVSAVDFTGWGECGPSGAQVVIRVGNGEQTRAMVGRRSVSTAPNVFLEFYEGAGAANCFSTTPFRGVTGRNWESWEHSCIDTTAVHEFAHVLGIAHEQNRPDTPSSCQAENDGLGDTPFGYWDLTSISNYCNPASNNDGRLSPLDVAGIQSLYGEDENALLWLGLGNVRQYARVDTDQLNFSISGTQISRGYQPVAGDFDGDGATDIFWYSPSGTDWTWWASGGGSFSYDIQTLGPGYQPFAGDFNGDGKTDIFLYRLSGRDAIWWSTGNRTFRGRAIQGFDAGYTPVVGDFDGDGYDDIFWYNPTGSDPLWWSNGDGTFASAMLPLGSGYRPFAGDFDGDGDDDIFLDNPSGLDYLLVSNGNRTFSTLAQTVGGSYTTAVGDFDGDGTDDILWNGYTDSLWLMKRPIGTKVVTNMEVHNLDATPIVGDFDADGHADILWYGGR